MKKKYSFLFPLAGLIGCCGGLYGISQLFPDSLTPISFTIRLLYSLLYTFLGEWGASYSHKYLWHSSALWWCHGSHHSQSPKFLSSPGYESEDETLEGEEEPPPQHQHQQGSRKRKKKSKFAQSSLFELNDVTVFVFASLCISLQLSGICLPNTYSKDCWVGISIGATLYGLSYFFGHDMVTHQRFGTKISDFFKNKIPYLRQCADAHMKGHHRYNRKVIGGYEGPYGFWLGPYEYERIKKRHEAKNEKKSGQNKKIRDELTVPMPPILQIAFFLSIFFACGMTIFENVYVISLPSQTVAVFFFIFYYLAGFCAHYHN